MNDLDIIHDHNINIKDRIIYLHQVDIEDSISFKTIPGLIKSLDYLNSVNKSLITIKLISCDGGDIGPGMSAYSAIRSSKSKVNIECSGFTASCSTLILQAANIRSVSKDGFFMIHFGSISLSTDVNTAQSILVSNTLWKNQLLNIYASRCVNGKFFKDRKYNLNRVRGYINTRLKNSGDWYIKDAEEIINFGFADKIME